MVLGRCKDALKSNWPDGVNFQPNGKYGAYLDIPLTEAVLNLRIFTLRWAAAHEKRTKTRCA